jgi:hypothetical protein
MKEKKGDGSRRGNFLITSVYRNVVGIIQNVAMAVLMQTMANN